MSKQSNMRHGYVVVLTLLCAQYGDLIDPCSPTPASNGFPYTITKRINKSDLTTGTLNWAFPNDYDITEMALKCNTNTQSSDPCGGPSPVETPYTGSLRTVTDDTYEASLTIDSVNRERDERIWSWRDGTRELGKCHLTVYSFSKGPVCYTIKVRESSVHWECLVSDVFPQIDCQMEFVNTASDGSVFTKDISHYMKSSHNSRTNAQRPSIISYYYSCILELPFHQLHGAGKYDFKMKASMDLSTLGLNKTVFKFYEDSDNKFEFPTTELRNCPGSTSDASDGKGYIKEGVTKMCGCHLTDAGYPPGVALWTDRDGTPIEEDRKKYSMAVLNLKFNPHDLQPKYFCRGRSPIGDGASVSYEPKFAYGPHKVSVVAHSMRPHNKGDCSRTDFYVDCLVSVADANPRPTMKMVLTSAEGPTTIRHKHEKIGSTTRNYVFRFEAEAGKYGRYSVTCVATNPEFPDMTAQHKTEVLIDEGPTTIRHKHEKIESTTRNYVFRFEAEAGKYGRYSVTCVATNPQFPDLTAQHKTEVLIDEGPTTIRHKHEKIESTTRNYVFRFKAEAGKYGRYSVTCVATNPEFPDLTAQHKTEVLIDAPTTAAIVMSITVNNGRTLKVNKPVVKVKLGDKVTVSCNSAAGVNIAAMTMTCGGKVKVIHGIMGSTSLTVWGYLNGLFCSCVTGEPNSCDGGVSMFSFRVLREGEIPDTDTTTTTTYPTTIGSSHSGSSSEETDTNRNDTTVVVTNTGLDENDDVGGSTSGLGTPVGVGIGVAVGCVLCVLGIGIFIKARRHVRGKWERRRTMHQQQQQRQQQKSSRVNNDPKFPPAHPPPRNPLGPNPRSTMSAGRYTNTNTGSRLDTLGISTKEIDQQDQEYQPGSVRYLEILETPNSNKPENKYQNLLGAAGAAGGGAGKTSQKLPQNVGVYDETNPGGYEEDDDYHVYASMAEMEMEAEKIQNAPNMNNYDNQDYHPYEIPIKCPKSGHYKNLAVTDYNGDYNSYSLANDWAFHRQ